MKILVTVKISSVCLACLAFTRPTTCLCRSFLGVVVVVVAVVVVAVVVVVVVVAYRLLNMTMAFLLLLY